MRKDNNVEKFTDEREAANRKNKIELLRKDLKGLLSHTDTRSTNQTYHE